MSSVELKIQRFDPERDAAPHWVSYTVPVEPMDRVLDVLANDAAGVSSAPLVPSTVKICAIGSTPCSGTSDITTAQGIGHVVHQTHGVTAG